MISRGTLVNVNNRTRYPSFHFISLCNRSRSSQTLASQLPMADLPPEVVTEILRRLPVKILLRSRCVCKWWRYLIDGPVFINMHLGLSIESNTNQGLILRHSSELYFVNFDSFSNAVELNHPLMCYSNRIKVLGSCNGLLCICNVAEDIALWNPSTKKYRILPVLPNNNKVKRDYSMCLGSVSCYGFGCDIINDDFKVVRILQFFGYNRASSESEVKVYSLRKNEWKRIQDMPYVFLYAQKMGVLAGGALHWVVEGKTDADNVTIVVAFDLAVEDFKEVQQPVYTRTKFEIELGVLGGCLCIIEKCRDVGVDVWVMKEYRVKESWTKLFSVSQPEVIRSFRDVRPLAYSENGGKVLLEQDNKMLLWYDLEKKTINKAQISGMPFSFEAVVCLGSLVPVDPSRRISKRKQVQEDFKKRDDFLSQGFKLVL